jgi:hypothetical protein
LVFCVHVAQFSIVRVSALPAFLQLATPSRATYIPRDVRHNYSRIDDRLRQIESSAEVSLTFQARKNAWAKSTP